MRANSNKVYICLLQLERRGEERSGGEGRGGEGRGEMAGNKKRKKFLNKNKLSRINYSQKRKYMADIKMD